MSSCWQCKVGLETLQSLNLMLCLTMLGVNSAVMMTCEGCKSLQNAPEYYCSHDSRYLFFRCESDSTSLIWRVSSPLFEESVDLSALSSVENIIRHQWFSVVLDAVYFNDYGEILMISYLWFNLGFLGSNLTVSCSDEHPMIRTLKLLGKYLKL